VLGHQLLEFGGEGAVPAERKLRFDPVLQRGEAARFEPLDLEPGKRFELKIGQRPAVPQRLRRTQQRRGPARILRLKRPSAGGHLLLERVQVQLAVLDAEHVPGRASEQPRLWVTIGERLAQAGNLNMEHRFSRTGRLITEQFVDQLVAGYDAVGVAQQQREQGTLLRPADPHRGAVEPDLERPEDSKLQTTAHVTPGLKCPQGARPWLALYARWCLERFLKGLPARLALMLYAAKCYWPGVAKTDVEQVTERAARAGLASGRTTVTYLGSLLFAADDLVLCLFQGSSRAAVIQASDRLGIPRERLMDSLWLGPAGPPGQGSRPGASAWQQ